MDDIDSIKRKIAALIAKAEGTDNLNEAMAFMAKANELLERYQLERHELHFGDPLGHEASDVSSSDAWIFKVVSASARYWGARVIWELQTTKIRKPYRVFGPESARVTFNVMRDYLLAQVRLQGRIYASEHHVTASVGSRNVGFAFAVRLNQLAAKNKMRRDEMASRALVPVDLTEQMIKDYYGQLCTLSKVRSGYSSTARDYADKIQLNSHVSSERRKMIS